MREVCDGIDLEKVWEGEGGEEDVDVVGGRGVYVVGREGGL